MVPVSPISFRVLGPLNVDVAGRALSLGGPKPRALLATLLLQPDVLVSTETLVDVLWPETPPPSATANVRTYVHNLRRRLAEGGTELAECIQSRASGYIFLPGHGELDMTEFEAHAAEAKQALTEGRLRDALEVLEQACGLWRGHVLEDLAHPHIWQSTVARLDELRVSVQQQRLKTKIELGQRDEAIAELRGLLAEHPLREELWQQLIQALVDSGRKAEALYTYAEVEQILLDELDTEPGPRLRELRAELLAATRKPRKARTSTPPSAPNRAPTPSAAAPIPYPIQQLPLDPPDFTGRTGTVDGLVRLLRERHSAGAPAVIVLSGTAGVGKSTIAVHAAHAVAAEFPEGQLHLDLRGTSSTARTPASVLAELLRGLGVPDSGMPCEVGERSTLLRSRLARRRMCIVFDDAGDAAQVRPLLPGTGACAVLITSRARMPELTGAHRVHVDVLPETEAVRLLAAIIGESRVSAEPGDATSIVRSCGCLPLAIRVVGAKLANRPHWSLRTLAERLHDEHRRLDELRIGDLEVRASVGLSYRQLRPEAALAFRRLGTLGAVTFPGWVVAALLGVPEADDVLDALVAASLVELVGSDANGQPRYRLHDLLRCHAAEQGERDDEQDRRKAIRRVLEGYVGLAGEAARRMPIHFFGICDVALPGDTWRPGEPDALLADPVAWFDAESHTAIAAVVLAERWNLDDLAWRLTIALTPYFDLHGHRDDWRHTHEIALAAARRTGDAYGQATVLRNLGQLYMYQDRCSDALAAFERSRQLFQRVHDDQGTAIALAGVGSVLRQYEQYEPALDVFHEVLELFLRVGDQHGEAVARISVGTAWLQRGCRATAGRWFTDAYELCARIGDRHREAHALKRLALLDQQLGNLAAARERMDQAIAIFDELGDDHCVGYAHQALGELCLRSGDLAHAQLLLVNSLSVHRRSGDRTSEAEAAELLGELHEALRQPERSRAYHQRAQVIRREHPVPGGADAPPLRHATALGPAG